MQQLNLEETYGPLLDQMSPAELDELLKDPFQKRMLRRLKANEHWLRPLLLQALHQQHTVNHNQQTLEF